VHLQIKLSDVLWQLIAQCYINVNIKDVAEARVIISVPSSGSTVCQV